MQRADTDMADSAREMDTMDRTYQYCLAHHTIATLVEIFCFHHPSSSSPSFSFMANSLWAKPLSPAILTGPRQLNNGLHTPLAPASSPFFFPHSHSPSTLYPYTRQPTQLMPFIHHQALYPHQCHPCTYRVFRPYPHDFSHKRQHHCGTNFRR
jgi:hypothetical protein